MSDRPIWKIENIIHAMMAGRWEEAKGSLRSLVEMGGSFYGGYALEEPKKYERLQEQIELFIKAVEDDELHLPEV